MSDLGGKPTFGSKPICNQAAFGKCDVNVERVTETLMPAALVPISIFASSCFASASMIFVPNPVAPIAQASPLPTIMDESHRVRLEEYRFRHKAAQSILT